MAWNTNPQQAWQVPSTDPQRQVNPQAYGPMQQQTAYSLNPVDTTAFTNQAKQANNYAGNLLGQGQNMATQYAGWNKDPSALMASWGANAYNPLDPYSNRQMAAGLGNMNANIGNSWQDYLGRAAGASANTTGRGVGVRGGANVPGEMWQQGVKAQTGMAAQNYKDMIAALNQSAGIQGSAMGNYLSGYGNMATGLLNSGNTQSAQALAALQAKQAAEAQYQAGLGQEQQYNANTYNTAQQQYQQQQQALAQQRAAQQAAQDQQMLLQQRLQSMTSRLNQPGQGNLGMGDKLNLDMLRVQSGEAQPWARTQAWSNQMGNQNTIQQPRGY